MWKGEGERSHSISSCRTWCWVRWDPRTAFLRKHQRVFVRNSFWSEDAVNAKAPPLVVPVVTICIVVVVAVVAVLLIAGAIFLKRMRLHATSELTKAAELHLPCAGRQAGAGRRQGLEAAPPRRQKHTETIGSHRKPLWAFQWCH